MLSHQAGGRGSAGLRIRGPPRGHGVAPGKRVMLADRAVRFMLSITDVRPISPELNVTGISSPAADALVRRLLAAAGVRIADASEPPADTAVAAAERASAEMADALARWFGPYGYHALITRALADARATHPALDGVHVRGPQVPVLDGLSEVAAQYGVDAMTDGVATVLSALIGLLGRVIGEEMALMLVERSMGRPDADVAHGQGRTSGRVANEEADGARGSRSEQPNISSKRSRRGRS